MENQLLAVISGAAGALVSWLFSYTPKLNEWYNARTSAQKGLIMVGAVLIVSGAVYGLSCANSPFNTGVTCDEAGLWQLGYIIVIALSGNQFAYLLSPQKKSAAVIEAQPEGESSFIDYPAAVDSPEVSAGDAAVNAALASLSPAEVTQIARMETDARNRKGVAEAGRLVDAQLRWRPSREITRKE